MTALLPPSSQFMLKSCAPPGFTPVAWCDRVEDLGIAAADVRDRLHAGRLGRGVAGCDRDRVEVVLRGDGEAAHPEVVDRSAEALRDPGCDDGHQRHEREADHQRGRGRSSPLRVPSRVVAGERPCRAAEPGCRRSERPGKRAHEPDCQERHADEDQQRPDTHGEQDLLRPEAVAEQAEDEQGEAGERQQSRADRPEARPAPGWQLSTLAHGRDRLHARGAHGRAEARQDGHEDPDDERDDHGPRMQDEAVVRQREADRVEQLEEPDAEPEPDEDPDDRGEAPITSASTTIENRTWPPRRAERSQGRQLTRPLRDRDRERVRDHERADEERDRAEREQEVLQEVEEALGVLRVRLRLLRAGLHLRARREDRADLGRELRGRHAGLRLRADLVELSDALEEPLCRRQVEARKRRAAETRRSAEVHEPGDLHLQRRPVRLRPRSSARPSDPSSARSPGRSRPRFRPGQVPSMSVRLLSSGCVGSTLKPRFGAPPKATTLPLTMRWAVPPTPPTASATSGSARDLRQQRLRRRAAPWCCSGRSA